MFTFATSIGIMKKVILFIFLLFVIKGLQAQDKEVGAEKVERKAAVSRQDSLKRSSKEKDSPKVIGALKKITGLDEATDKGAKIEDYLIISSENDTTYVDTTLSIRKEYKFNYLRKDDFEVMPFSKRL